MSHEIQPNEVTVRFDLELTDVTDAEVALIEASLGELIQAVVLSQEEEGRGHDCCVICAGLDE